MLSFTRAPTVAKGQKITSDQMRRLALAFNDRIRSGVGDMAWRIAWYWYNLWRQVRNPDESGYVFPSQGEFFDIYQAIEPEWSPGTTWPEAAPGDPEGANIANPMMQFVFGNPVVDSEDVRLNFTVPLWLSGSPPSTPEEFWTLAKYQRGAYDPETGAQFTPAFSAAESVFNFAFPYWSPHGKAYGGWQPIPTELLADCGGGDPADPGSGVPSWELFFTALRKDVSTAGFHGTVGVNADGYPTVTYSGTCPCGSAEFGAGHVLYLAELRFIYVVYVATGSPDCAVAKDVFPLKDWIQGPYTSGADLHHTEGKQLSRAVNAFSTDFRGTTDQRSYPDGSTSGNVTRGPSGFGGPRVTTPSGPPDDFDIEKLAFDFDEFHRRQYYLSPNIGVDLGSSIEERYPTATFGGGLYLHAGTLGVFSGGGTTHVYHDGFVLAGVFARAEGLREPITIELLDGAAVFQTLTLVPGPDGTASIVNYLKRARTPAPLSVRLATNASFGPPGDVPVRILVQVTEQYAYKPEFWDAYLITRMAASKGGDAFSSNDPDGRGKDTDFAAQISKDYFKRGCLVNPRSDTVRELADWVNDNPVYDAARRASKSQVRIIRRQQLVAYEVANGKSILYVRRFAFGLENTRVDLLDGIAPPLDPIESGDLVKGETYVVRGSGRVAYNGGIYSEGQTFTAIGGRAGKTYQATGDAEVFVHDGIKHVAIEKGYTNEWVSFLETKRYHPSATSVWKEEAYADYFTWCNRCHFFSGSANAKLRRFFNYNNAVDLDPDTFLPALVPMRVQNEFLSPEAPSGFNYSMGANVSRYGLGGPPFYKSCQVYQAPLEIESCVVDDAANGTVKITFTGRFQSHELAPAVVAKDPSTWSAGDIDILRNVGDAGEDYRTPDNALREYFLLQADGSKQCTVKTGDSGVGSSVDSLPDNPFGCCYPHLFLVSLINLPYEDDNSTAEDHDSRCVIDAFQKMEVALRAGCEGFVDGVTSQDLVCRYYLAGLRTMFDYSFENLCFEAFKGRWIGAFSLAVRSDQPAGFGAAPNTLMYADVFNRLSSAVNLLDKARLDVPFRFRYRLTGADGEREVPAVNCSATLGCSESATTFAYLDGAAAPAANNHVTVSADFYSVGFTTSKSAGMIGCPFKLSSSREDADAAIEIDPDFVDAVPAQLRELINNGFGGFIGLFTYTISSDKREIVTTPGAGDGCYPPGATDQWFDSSDPGKKFRWVYARNDAWTECHMVTGGHFEAPPLPVCDYRYGFVPAGGFCNNGPSTSLSVDLLTDQGAFIQVPIAET